jgi:pantetheine-phosphate adenylyltransferase
MPKKSLSDACESTSGKIVKRAVYAGSFDPFTNGHAWVVAQGMAMFDEIIVAIGENPEKKYTFSLAERLDMLKESVALIQQSSPFGQSSVVVDHFINKFLINYAHETNSGFILRGIRNIADFEFEKTIRNVNADLIGHDRITTVFLIPPRELGELSSSFVKGLCGPENWQPIVEKLVPPPVYQRLVALKSNSIQAIQPRQ